MIITIILFCDNSSRLNPKIVGQNPLKIKKNFNDINLKGLWTMLKFVFVYGNVLEKKKIFLMNHAIFH